MKRTKRPPRIKGRKLKAGERSLAYLRRQGWTAEVCEQFKALVEGQGQQAIFKGGFRKDLFGFVDILAYQAHETLAVQATSRQQMTAHLRKYRRDPEIRQRILDWIACPNRRLQLLGWECVEVPCKSRAGTKAEWRVTKRDVMAADLIEAVF